MMRYLIFTSLLAVQFHLYSDAQQQLNGSSPLSKSSCFISATSAFVKGGKQEENIVPLERYNRVFLQSHTRQFSATLSQLRNTSVRVDNNYNDIKTRQRKKKRVHHHARSNSALQNPDEILKELDNMNLTRITALMNELSRQRAKDSAQKLELILRSLERKGENGGFTPNVVHYALTINGWANNGDKERAESILNEMIEKVSQENAVLPNSHCFSGVMKAHVKWWKKMKNNKNESNHVIQKCEELFDKMMQLHKKTSNQTLKPNVIIFNTLLDVYSKGSAIAKAKELFEKMLEGYYKIYPDQYSYCSVISALAQSGDAQCAELAENYLLQMMNAPEMQPDLPTFNAVLSAWARIGSIDGAQRAESLLNKMENQYFINESDNFKYMPPNAVSYNTVIYAWINSTGGKYAALQAESVLHRMERNHHQWVENKKSIDSKINHSQPNVISYSSIIDCWSKSGSSEAGDRAQMLLDRMEMLSESGSNKLVTPNVVTYSSVLSSYGRSGLIDSADKAHSLLTHMKNLHQTGKNPKAKPNVVSYFAVIDSWARSNHTDAGFNALSLLKEMENLCLEGDKDVKPNIRCYARVLVALASSRKKGSDRSAEQLLTAMEEFDRTGNKKYAQQRPNVICYNTLINSYAKRGKANRAIAILNKMDQYSSISKNERNKIRPDAHTLNSIIYSLSKSNEKNKGRKALKILQRMERSHVFGDWRVTPSTQSYNMVINACSTTCGNESARAEAMRVALDTFYRLQCSKYAHPDRYTYISLLKTCGRQLSVESSNRTMIIENVFNNCCEDGIVDDSILQNFILAAPVELKEKIYSQACPIIDDSELNYESLTTSILPRFWTRNVISTKS